MKILSIYFDPVPLIIMPIILFIVLNVIVSLKMRDAVEKKGYNANSMHIFALCFLIPIFGHLYALALPDMHIQIQNQQIINLLSTIANNKTNSSAAEAPNSPTNTNNNINPN